MANRSRELQPHFEASRDDFELEFDELTFPTFPNLDFQSHIGIVGEQPHGAFNQPMARGSVPVPVARAQPVSPQMERMTSLASFPGSAGPLPTWSYTSSPEQDVHNTFDVYSNHPSPMLAAWNASLAGSVGPSSSSLNEHLTAFSLGSAGSEPMSFQLNDVSFTGGAGDHQQMGSYGVRSFFMGEEMVSAIVHSPIMHAQSSDAFGSWPASIRLTPDLSPSLVGQAGSVDTSMSPGLGSLPSITPFVSPLVMPENAAMDAIPGLDLTLPAEVDHVPEASTSPPKNDVRRRANSQSSTIGFVHMEPDGSRGGKILTARNAGAAKGKTAGRRGRLEAKVRQKAGMMRVLGACPNCRKRKASCDSGIYCRSCIRHYGVQILQSPCRGKVLSDLAEGLMRVGIFPTYRPVESFLPAGYNPTVNLLQARLMFGFGPSIAVMIRIIIPNGDKKASLSHRHLMYEWPLGEKGYTERRQYEHDVFPAVLPDETQLRALLEQQLTVLVEDHFESFPWHRSKLDVLPAIHKFYKMIPDSEVRSLLNNCLRLLVLVHIGGDFQMDANDANCRKIYANLIKAGLLKSDGNGACTENFDTCPRNMGRFPVPCFIRGQFGKVMPQLANDLMVDILRQLEKFCLTQKCELWVPVLAAFTVIIMTVESIDYHAEKASFHASLDHGAASAPAPPTHVAASAQSPTVGPSAGTHSAGCVSSHGDLPPNRATPALSEQAFNFLLRFYHACFPSCHSQLTDLSTARPRSYSTAAAALSASGQKEAQHTFIAELKTALSSAGSYLTEKGHDPRVTSDDLSFFFDRKLARFLLGLELSH